MKKEKSRERKEKEIRALEYFGTASCVVTAVFCVLFLFDVFQNRWVLNFILGTAVLMHTALLLLMFLRRKRILSAVAALAVLCYAGCLIYFNIG